MENSTTPSTRQPIERKAVTWCLCCGCAVARPTRANPLIRHITKSEWSLWMLSESVCWLYPLIWSEAYITLCIEDLDLHMVSHPEPHTHTHKGVVQFPLWKKKKKKWVHTFKVITVARYGVCSSSHLPHGTTSPLNGKMLQNATKVITAFSLTKQNWERNRFMKKCQEYMAI